MLDGGKNGLFEISSLAAWKNENLQKTPALTTIKALCYNRVVKSYKEIRCEHVFFKRNYKTQY